MKKILLISMLSVFLAGCVARTTTSTPSPDDGQPWVQWRTLGGGIYTVEFTGTKNELYRNGSKVERIKVFNDVLRSCTTENNLEVEKIEYLFDNYGCLIGITLLAHKKMER